MSKYDDPYTLSKAEKIFLAVIITIIALVCVFYLSIVPINIDKQHIVSEIGIANAEQYADNAIQNQISDNPYDYINVVLEDSSVEKIPSAYVAVSHNDDLAGTISFDKIKHINIWGDNTSTHYDNVIIYISDNKGSLDTSNTPRDLRPLMK